MPGNPANGAATQARWNRKKTHFRIQFLRPRCRPALSGQQMETLARSERCFHETFPARPRCRRGFCFRCTAAVTSNSQATFDRLFQPLVNARQIPFLRFPPHRLHYPAQTSSMARPVRRASLCESLDHVAPARECCRQSGCGNRSRTVFFLATCRQMPRRSWHSFVRSLRRCGMSRKTPQLAASFFAFIFGKRFSSMLILKTEPSSVRSG